MFRSETIVWGGLLGEIQIGLIGERMLAAAAANGSIGIAGRVTSSAPQTGCGGRHD
jgi:hypothetical protein